MAITQQTVTSAPFIVLSSRDLYVTTKIWLPGESKPIPAIQIGGRYYSFFRTIDKAADALALTTKLCDRNNPVALIKIPKGYSVWVLEPDAMPQDLKKLMQPLTLPAPCRFLTAGKDSFRPLNLRVPDLEQPISGIYYERRYYSIFRIESQIASMFEIVSQLAQRDDESIVIHQNREYVICILEPEATPV